MFMILFYSTLMPAMTAKDMYTIMFSAQVAASGLGFLIGAIVPPKNAQLAAVCAAALNMALGGVMPQLNIFRDEVMMTSIFKCSIMRWYVGAMFVKEQQSKAARLGTPIVQEKVRQVIDFMAYSQNEFDEAISALWILAVVFMVLAFVRMYADLKLNGR
jgi:hypothetical protein